jgi:hypothetical protein
MFAKEQGKDSWSILEHVHLANGTPDWKVVAASLRKEQSGSNNNNNKNNNIDPTGTARNTTTPTPWQTYCAHQTQLKAAQTATWTCEEDQLLLYYIAAMGPQEFVLDTARPSAPHLAAQTITHQHVPTSLGACQSYKVESTIYYYCCGK